MTIRDLVTQYLLSQATVTALVGTRIKPDMLPQKTTYPAVVLRSIDVVRPPTLTSVAGLATARIQVDVYADATSGSARAMADRVATAIRLVLDGFGWKDGADLYLTDATASPGDVRAWIRHANERDAVEPGIAGGLSERSDDYLVQFQTSGGSY